MAYNISQLDKDNSKWFENDNSRQSLCGISLENGSIRGLTPFKVEIRYPITAFSGSNGSGKSTILALAACAFHNKKTGFTPPLRNKTYYTFSDFFVQSNDESAVEGVQISYYIRYNDWSGRKPGIGRQLRKKKKGGKWSDYDRRVDRNVIYFGVQRVAPHYERSTHKSYRSKFKPGSMSAESREKISHIAARIIGKKYSDFDSHEHSKYTLPVTSVNGVSYSGFNMGAGEGSVFEILSALFAAGPGSLMVIDEIELGLHEMAQVRLIEELKKLCNDMKCQVICSTHSHAVLRSLPPEARFHIESIAAKTFITPGASPDFACGKMGRPEAHELDIFVEDRVAAEILHAALSADLRKRVKVKPIGSHAAVIRQLASRKLESVNNCICILDGDQSGSLKDAVGIAQAACEVSTKEDKDAIETWTKERVFFLPGSSWPEKWVIARAQEIVDDCKNSTADALVSAWGLPSRDVLKAHLDEAEGAKKHNEFHELAAAIELSEEKSRSDIITFVVQSNGPLFVGIIEAIKERLP